MSINSTSSMNPTANISQYFLDYLKTKMSDTINDFSSEVASSYKVDAAKIIEIWNRVCPDIEIQLKNKENKENKEQKKSKPIEEIKNKKEVKEVSKKDNKKESIKDKSKDQDEGITGPDSDKIYDKNDIIDLLVNMINKNEVTKDQLKADIDNLKLIKKLLKKRDYEVSKSIIKKILKKPNDIIKKCELETKFVKVDDLEEFTMDE